MPLTQSELAAIRQHSLTVAIDNAPNGAQWDAILKNAKRFEEYIVTGKTEKEQA